VHEPQGWPKLSPHVDLCLQSPCPSAAPLSCALIAGTTRRGFHQANPHKETCQHGLATIPNTAPHSCECILRWQTPSSQSEPGACCTSTVPGSTASAIICILFLCPSAALPQPHTFTSPASWPILDLGVCCLRHQWQPCCLAHKRRALQLHSGVHEALPLPGMWHRGCRMALLAAGDPMSQAAWVHQGSGLWMQEELDPILSRDSHR
jgi:hypothetical protein